MRALLLVAFFCLSPSGTIFAQAECPIPADNKQLVIFPPSEQLISVPLEVPPEPPVKPASYSGAPPMDPTLDSAFCIATKVLANPSSSQQEKAAAQATLDERISVYFLFERQITLDELNSFVRLGGVVTYIFQANYGWIGIIPLGAVPNAAASMKLGFQGVDADSYFSADPGPKPVLVTPHQLWSLQLILGRSSGRAITLSVESRLTNLLYIIQASPDLKIWTNLTTLNATNGGLVLTNALPATIPTRFFRALAAPSGG